MIDEEGVIPESSQQFHKAAVALNQLGKDPRNLIIIVSRDTKHMMHERYASLAPHIGLAAENGFFYIWNSIDKKNDDWNRLLDTKDFSWIEHVKEIMESYMRKTFGSTIE